MLVRLMVGASDLLVLCLIFFSLIKECWDSDPTKRPTFAACIKRLEKIQLNAGFVSNDALSEKIEKREKCTIM